MGMMLKHNCNRRCCMLLKIEVVLYHTYSTYVCVMYDTYIQSPAPASPFDKFRICRVTPYGIIVSALLAMYYLLS